MQLYYTGAKAPEAEQINPELSLGGYQASSLIPNGNVNSLFPTITKSHVQSNKIDVRMIVLKNTTTSIVNNLTIWTEAVFLSKVKIAAVEPALDVKCNIEYYESIDNGNSLPYQVTLELHEGQANALVVGSLDPGKMIGVWIERELDLTKFSDDEKGTSNSQIDCEACISSLQAPESVILQDEIKVFFNWD